MPDQKIENFGANDIVKESGGTTSLLRHEVITNLEDVMILQYSKNFQSI